MRASIWSRACLYSALLSVSLASEVRAELPQDHSYQIALRDYLSTLTATDFTVPLQELTYSTTSGQPGYIAPGDTDNVYKTWLLLDKSQNFLMPNFNGVRYSPSYFTLGTIESGGTVNMSQGRGAWIDITATAFYSQWNHTGNPYYNNAAVKKRAIVAASVDMMMLDAAHAQDLTIQRSDYLGGNLINHAYAYLAAKSIMTPAARLAYEEGLRKEIVKIETWGPRGIYGDMDSFAIVGMYYAAQAIGNGPGNPDPDLAQRAHNYAQRVYDKHLTAAGYMAHGSSLDPSYQGIDLFFNVWAAQISKDPLIIDCVDKMSKIKAYLTLPDVDGKNFYGPTSFATATAADTANDQWFTYARDVGAASVSDQAKYLVFTGRNRPVAQTLKTEADMRTAINSTIGTLDTSVLSTASGVWKENHWAGNIDPHAESIPDGLYSQLSGLKTADSPLTKAPYQKSDDFIETFSNEFMCSRIATGTGSNSKFNVIIHTGRLSWWDDHPTNGSLAGLSGGSLAAFGTDLTGPVILGRATGYQNPVVGDTWSNWQYWAVHAISGVAATGAKPFSSAREKDPVANYTITGPAGAVASVSGSLTGEYSSPDEALVGLNTYRRTFTVDDQGVRISTDITGDGRDLVNELWETIPVFMNNPGVGSGAASISLLVGDLSGDAWQNATTALTGDVSAIRIVRGNGAVYITFATPEYVKLSPGVWSGSNQQSISTRNIMIDFLDGAGPSYLTNRSIDYRISDQINPVPEPTALSLLTLGGLVSLFRRRRP